MTIHSEHGLDHRRAISRLRLIWNIVLRSTTMGLISGALLGGLFGFIFAFWTGMVGAGLGLGLGLVNGLLLSVLTCLCFYPLKYVRLYRWIVKAISALVAGGGAAVFGPWYFSSTSMTPSSAVLIGFGSVLASVIAGLAGGLVGQDIAWWYEQNSEADRQELTFRQSLHRSITLNKTEQYLDVILPPKALDLGWNHVVLLSLLLCPFWGNRLLQLLVCGTQDVISCLPSPRLYTSVVAGFKAVLPIILVVTLIVIVFRSHYKVRLHIDQHRILLIHELFGHELKGYVQRERKVSV